MCGTSVDLAIKNLTTVERLRAKSKVHILAIRKPHSSQTPGTGVARSYKAPYREITYPLDASLFSSASGPRTLAAEEARDNNSAQDDQSNPGTAQQDHVTQAEVPTTSRIDDSEQQTRYPVVANSEGHVSLPRPVTDATNRDGHQTMEGGARQLEQSRAQPFPHGASARDLQASRTFAIVHTLEPGDNPWDLGSAILNLNTVMGNNILEWFLPTASPCSNHESTESQFALGPAVKRLRAEYGLVQQEGTSEMVDGTRKANIRHSLPENLHDRNTPTRVHHDNQSVHPSDNYIKLQDLFGRAVHS
jgi:palmitoyltransferase